MESIAALGLASNIIQIVDFSLRVISKSRELYHSVDGRVAEHADLDEAAQRLSNLLGDLQDYGTLGDFRKVTNADKQLFQLRSECEKVAREIQAALQNVRLEPSNKHKKWQSVQKALLSVRSDRQISALALRFDRIRGQIDTATLMSIRAARSHDPETAIEAHSTESSPDSYAKLRLSELLESTLHNNWQPSLKDDVTAFSTHMSHLSSESLFRRAMLARLHFEVMPDREDSIPEAHFQTFKWLLEDDLNPRYQPSWTSVGEWLQASENNMYWITGKPGSGKSTLMKYLHHHDALPTLLRKWAEPNKLITAGFYFWNSGSVMQMSLSGLLRAFLYECFLQDGSLLLQTMPERWEQFNTFGGGQGDFGETELCRLFGRVVSDASRRFFFLIDGLDEFEGQPRDIIDFVLGAAQSNVKLCVASRPWPAFEDAFDRRPTLLLEDLTKEDIATYVSSHFEHNNHFAQLQSLDSQAASNLLRSIVDKASGVFLWVYLVVQKLLEGLQDSDRLSDLHANLDALPRDLDHLFSNLLGRLSSDHFRQACGTFRLLRAYREISEESVGPTLLALYFADDRDIKSSLQTNAKAPDRIASIETAMRRRLNARCKGFLETTKDDEDGPNRVIYLHRTARDFLESLYWPIVLETTGNDSFEADKQWANALLWLLRVENPTSSDIIRFVKCISMIERRTDTVQKTYLDWYYYYIGGRHPKILDVSKLVYNVELLTFWTDYDEEGRLDAYMSLVLDMADSKLRDAILESYVGGGDLYQARRSYYRTPRMMRRFRKLPSLPRCE